MEDVTVITKARGLLRDLSVTSYPVDVEAIAAHLGFEIKISEKLGPDEAGSLITLGDRKIILVNKNDSPYRQRFTVLHEIAHEFLGLPSNHGHNISSRELESYIARPREEALCDVFAAECLLPWKLLAPLTDEMPYEVSSIRALSSDFQASLPCVASRFAQVSRGDHVYVLSEGGVIRIAVASQSVRERKYWVDSGVNLPLSSAVMLARANRKHEETAESDGIDWSKSACATSIECYEEAIFLPEWEQGISLLTLDVVERMVRDQKSYDDEGVLLEELTGELPWPKR